MSDIVEDSKVHYIVKDYKRMYDGFHALIEENKALKKEVDVLQTKVEKLQAKLEKYKNEEAKKEKAETKKNPNKRIIGVLNEIEARSNAIVNDLQKRIESINGIINNAEEIRTFLND